MLVVYLIFHYMIERNRRLSVKRDYKSKFERLIYHPVFMVITLILLFVAISFLGGIVISKVDPVRTGKLFDLTRYKQFGILGWASQLEIAERIIYWMAAFKGISDAPMAGCGPGWLWFLLSADGKFFWLSFTRDTKNPHGREFYSQRKELMGQASF